jgi:hypothetical protein
MRDIMEQDEWLRYASGAPERIALHPATRKRALTSGLAGVAAKKRTKKAQTRGVAAGSEEPGVDPQLPQALPAPAAASPPSARGTFLVTESCKASLLSEGNLGAPSAARNLGVVLSAVAPRTGPGDQSPKWRGRRGEHLWHGGCKQHPVLATGGGKHTNGQTGSKGSSGGTLANTTTLHPCLAAWCFTSPLRWARGC